MSQLMSGSASSPLATSDHDFSLFKLTAAQERTAMAASKKQNVNPVAPATVEPTPVDTHEDGDELARLKAERKASNLRIKELQAAKKAAKPEKAPKQEKTLATIEAEQATHLSADTARLARRVAVRETAGQPREDAIAAVMQDHAVAIRDILELFDTGNYPSLEHALDDWTAQYAPNTVKVAGRKHAKPSAE